MPSYFLQHGGVGLRPLDLQDLSGGYPDWFNDPEVCRYNSHHVFPTTRDSLQQFLLKQREDNTRLVLAVDRLDQQKHIGNLSLQRINHVDRNAEFAILMGDKDSWGHGFAKAASSLICWHGFQALNLHRIYCGTHADNLAMVKLAAHLQMKPEGRYREALFKDGVFVDALRFGVLKSAFVTEFKARFLDTLEPGA